MSLFTVIVSFEDNSKGIEQVESESPILALLEFVQSAESLEDHDRLLIRKTIIDNSQSLIHVANNTRGIWLWNHGSADLGKILGGFIIQTDPDAPMRLKEV